MINLEIAKVNSQYLEEGATLSRNLLPYVSKVTDYRFLTEEMHFMASRFLASLTVHVKDSDEDVTQGFILFALHLKNSIRYYYYKL